MFTTKLKTVTAVLLVALGGLVTAGAMIHLEAVAAQHPKPSAESTLPAKAKQHGKKREIDDRLEGGSWEVISVKATDEKATGPFGMAESIDFPKVGKDGIPDDVTLNMKSGSDFFGYKVITLGYTLHPSSAPQGVDFHIPSSIADRRLIRKEDQTFRWIYAFKGDTLEMCANVLPGERPAGFDLRKGTNRVLLVLKRKQDKEKPH
jgi:uncharacterized protein (TIGR03067 family)